MRRASTLHALYAPPVALAIAAALSACGSRTQLLTCLPSCPASGCGTDDGCGSTCGCPLSGQACTAGQCRAAPVVLFGGELGPSAGLHDTWEWDGGTWTQRNVLGPPGRYFYGMAALGGRAVLFGGEQSTPMVSPPYFADTWQWDGNTWTARNVAGPSPRASHAMATLGGKIVLFGGGDGVHALFGDTWVWDGSTWTARGVSGPGGRFNHAMATLGDRVVLFGGGTNSGPASDTWEWDGTSWTERNVPGPSPRELHAMATLGEKIVLFGGDERGGDALGDTWEWDGKAWTERNVSGPSPRYDHAMAAFEGKVVLMGGVQGPGEALYADTWEWDGSAWTERKVAGPGARLGHAMVAR